MGREHCMESGTGGLTVPAKAKGELSPSEQVREEEGSVPLGPPP